MSVAALGQYPTPQWAAEALVERYFSDLGMYDTVLEPSCGDGRFLHAVPAHVPAIGVEIDPALAIAAHANTGRRIVVGDFRTVEIDVAPTTIIGNPPFNYRTINEFLDRAHQLLPAEGRVGFLLPVYYFQTAARVVELTQRWSLAQELIPRNLYPRLRLPLCFAMLRKGAPRTLVGFALYSETDAVRHLGAPYRDQLSQPARSVWEAVVGAALARLGGEATLQDLYSEIEGKRPTANRWWREKVRQVVQARCRRLAPGRWAVAA